MKDGRMKVESFLSQICRPYTWYGNNQGFIAKRLRIRRIMIGSSEEASMAAVTNSHDLDIDFPSQFKPKLQIWSSFKICFGENSALCISNDQLMVIVITFDVLYQY